MKKLLIGITLLASMSIFAGELLLDASCEFTCTYSKQEMMHGKVVRLFPTKNYIDFTEGLTRKDIITKMGQVKCTDEMISFPEEGARYSDALAAKKSKTYKVDVSCDYYKH